MPNTEVVMIGLFIAPALESWPCRFSVRICRVHHHGDDRPWLQRRYTPALPRRRYQGDSMTSWYLWNIFKHELFMTLCVMVRRRPKWGMVILSLRRMHKKTCVQLFKFLLQYGVGDHLVSWYNKWSLCRGTYGCRSKFLTPKLMVPVETLILSGTQNSIVYRDHVFSVMKALELRPFLTGTSARRPSLAWSLRRVRKKVMPFFRFADSAVGGRCWGSQPFTAMPDSAQSQAHGGS